MQMRVSRSTALMLGVLVASILLIALIVWGDRRGGLRYTVTFADAAGVTEGTPVRLGRDEIGHVEFVRVKEDGSAEMGLRIQRDFAEAIHQPPNTTARVRRARLGRGTTHVEVLNRGEVGGGVPDGAVVQGLDGWSDELRWTAGARAAEAWERLGVSSRGQIAALEEWLQTRDASQVRDSVVDFLSEFEGAAADRAEIARERLAGLVDRARALGNELRRSPEARTAARDVERALETVLEGSEQLSAEARERLDRVLDELRQGTASGS